MNIYQVLFGSLVGVLNSSEFNKKKEAIEDTTFDKVFVESESGHLNWQRTEESLRFGDSAIATVTIVNSENKEISFPVLLYSGEKENDVCWFYLALGEKNGPTRNSIDQRVKNLTKKVFGLTTA